MKRFVDLRGMSCDGRFAWYDTVVCQFEHHLDVQNQTWDFFEEFEEDYEGDQIERYRGLTPEWAFRAPVSDEVMDKLLKIRLISKGMCSEEFDNFVKDELKEYQDILDEVISKPVNYVQVFRNLK